MSLLACQSLTAPSDLVVERRDRRRWLARCTCVAMIVAGRNGAYGDCVDVLRLDGAPLGQVERFVQRVDQIVPLPRAAELGRRDQQHRLRRLAVRAGRGER